MFQFFNCFFLLNLNDCHILDPANENMEYTPAVDVSELIKHDEVMKHFKLGPNGALIYCMEFLETNIKWLITKVLNLKDHYLIFDCPGQVSYSIVFKFSLFCIQIIHFMK